MPKRLILTEEQFNNLINEELGVSNFVIEKTNELFSIIENALLNCNESEDFDNYSIKKCTVRFSLLDVNISCSLEFYNYYNREYYDYSNVSSDAWSVYLGKKTCFMGIIVPCISGTIVKNETFDSIQHELEHIYQQVIMKKPFSDSITYAKIKTNMYSENELVNKTARLVYGCIKSEQDGFVNGLYAYLMSLPEFFSMTSLKNSSAWKLYEDMINIYNQYFDNIEFINELKKYNLTINKVNQKINQFIRKIGRVVIKIKQDKYKKQGWKN